MTAKFLMAGNWKMNQSQASLADYVSHFQKSLAPHSEALRGKVDILFAVPYTLLTTCQKLFAGSGVIIAAQNAHWEEAGAFTGEISLPMLKEIGIRHTLVAHSERRQYFNESDETARKKVKKCLELGVTPILCIGETLAERKAEQTEAVISKQLQGVFEVISQPAKVILAYEPVWAIGTGLAASPEQAAAVHSYIYSLLTARFGPQAAAETRILYGGSMNSANTRELLQQKHIHGGLVGGASLKPEDFAQMILIAAES